MTLTCVICIIAADICEDGDTKTMCDNEQTERQSAAMRSSTMHVNRKRDNRPTTKGHKLCNEWHKRQLLKTVISTSGANHLTYHLQPVPKWAIRRTTKQFQYIPKAAHPVTRHLLRTLTSYTHNTLRTTFITYMLATVRIKQEKKSRKKSHKSPDHHNHHGQAPHATAPEHDHATPTLTRAGGGQPMDLDLDRGPNSQHDDIVMYESTHTTTSMHDTNPPGYVPDHLDHDYDVPRDAAQRRQLNANNSRALTGILWLNQEKQFCGPTSLNMAFGTTHFTGMDVLRWCNTVRDHLNSERHKKLWKCNYNSKTGLFSTPLLHLFLKHNYNVGLLSHPVPSTLKNNQTNIHTLLDQALHRAQTTLNSPCMGMLACTQEPYPHFTTVIKPGDNRWRWLDSERPGRADLGTAANQLEFKNRVEGLYMIIPMASFDGRDIREPTGLLDAIPDLIPRTAPKTLTLTTPTVRMHAHTRTTAPPQDTRIPRQERPAQQHDAHGNQHNSMHPNNPTRSRDTMQQGQRQPPPSAQHQKRQADLATDVRAHPTLDINQAAKKPHSACHRLKQQAKITAYLGPEAHTSKQPKPHTPTPPGPTDPGAPPTENNLTGTLTMATYNIQGIRKHTDDIHTLIKGTKPHILVITETHLVSDQHHHMDKVRTLLSDYHLYLSSTPRKQMPAQETKHEGHQRTNKLYAPGGVLLALHKTISKPHLTQVHATPDKLHGYLVHVTIGSTTHPPMHIMGVYATPTCPTTRRNLFDHLETISNNPAYKTHNFIIQGDWNATLQNSDRSNYVSTPLDTAYRKFLQDTHLTPLDYKTRHRPPTFLSHDTRPYTSRIDDILFSRQLAKNITSNKHNSYVVNTVDDMWDSDHVPLTCTLDTDLVPLTRYVVAPNPEAQATIKFKFPIPKEGMETARTVLAAEFGIDAANLALHARSLTESAVTLLNGDHTSHAVTQARTELNAMYSTMVTDLAGQVMDLLHNCHKRVQTLWATHTAGPRKSYMRRTANRALANLRHERQILRKAATTALSLLATDNNCQGTTLQEALRATPLLAEHMDVLPPTPAGDAATPEQKQTTWPRWHHQRAAPRAPSGPYGKSSTITVDRGTIQGDTLSPFLFLVFIEPLLRWHDTRPTPRFITALSTPAWGSPHCSLIT
eukprot:CAMPEP_0202893002 /NCGR_PEP_ID=MMETSP1392-20130828/2661_1 /ASSEMBLY_ACC=CAM_ASM_000868 /TAXON_ID=225041 /ORGANISM="Chlamydomonas chlamydogama, Strain SAG 11-48b" /LENGTH=1146 /DNA_ID=CAMNT_0049577175 /DNA_START=646 /DNA_END=4086 /DNA_ORIENTATION=-